MLQQQHALVDVFRGEQPKLIQAEKVHCEGAPQFHAPQNVGLVVECEGLASCRHLHKSKLVISMPAWHTAMFGKSRAFVKADMRMVKLLCSSMPRRTLALSLTVKA